MHKIRIFLALGWFATGALLIARGGQSALGLSPPGPSGSLLGWFAIVMGSYNVLLFLVRRRGP